MRLPLLPAADLQEFQDLDDADLLEFVALREEDPELGEPACWAFYSRHAPYLYNTLRRFARQLGGDQGVRSLMLETMEKAFQAAHTFSKKDGDDKTIIRAKVRAWLNTIAKNIFRSYIRGRREDLADDFHTIHQQDAIAQDLDEDGDPSPQRQLLDDCLEMLPVKQRDALILSYQFYDETREHNRLTNEEARSIAHDLGTTTVNLRQLRSRAEKKLRECVEVGGRSGG